MLFNIPQFIDVEDKIVGPLTAKQLGWLAMGGVFSLLAFTFFDMSTFIGTSVVIAVIFGGLAFYRPNGQSLISMIGSIVVFFSRPKMYIWKRVSSGQSAVRHKKSTVKVEAPQKHKNLTAEEIEETSHLLEITKK